MSMWSWDGCVCVCVWIWGDDAQKLAEYQNQNQNRPELTWLLLLRFLTHAGLSVKQSLAEMFPLQPKTTRGDQGCAEKREMGDFRWNRMWGR